MLTFFFFFTSSFDFILKVHDEKKLPIIFVALILFCKKLLIVVKGKK